MFDDMRKGKGRGGGLEGQKQRQQMEGGNEGEEERLLLEVKYA